MAYVSGQFDAPGADYRLNWPGPNPGGTNALQPGWSLGSELVRAPLEGMWDDPYWSKKDDAGISQRIYSYMFGADLDPGITTQNTGTGANVFSTLGGEGDRTLGEGILANDDLLPGQSFQNAYGATELPAGGDAEGGYILNQLRAPNESEMARYLLGSQEQQDDVAGRYNLLDVPASLTERDALPSHMQDDAYSHRDYLIGNLADGGPMHPGTSDGGQGQYHIWKGDQPGTASHRQLASIASYGRDDDRPWHLEEAQQRNERYFDILSNASGGATDSFGDEYLGGRADSPLLVTGDTFKHTGNTLSRQGLDGYDYPYRHQDDYYGAVFLDDAAHAGLPRTFDANLVNQQIGSENTGELGTIGAGRTGAGRLRRDLSGRLITPQRRDIAKSPGRSSTRLSDEALLEGYFGGSLLGGLA